MLVLMYFSFFMKNAVLLDNFISLFNSIPKLLVCDFNFKVYGFTIIMVQWPVFLNVKENKTAYL